MTPEKLLRRLCVGLALCAATSALADCTFQPGGQWGGPSRATASAANRVYTGIGAKFIVLNTTNPASPVEMGELILSQGHIEDIVLTGTYAVCASRGGRAYVVNIASPTAPTVVSEIDLGEPLHKMTIAGSNLFVGGESGLHVVSLQDPAQPATIGFLATAGECHSVGVSGTTAVLGVADIGFVTVNVANPSQPTLIAPYGTNYPALDVKFQGSVAYLAMAYDGVLIYNISNPAQPQYVGQLNTPGSAEDLQLDGTRIFIADWTAGLVIGNISNPALPTILGQFNTTGVADAVSLNGNTVAIADGASIRLVNAANSANPTLLGSIAAGGLAYNVARNGNFAYVASWYDGVEVIDTSDPFNPTFVRAAAAAPGSEQPTQLLVSGGYLYMNRAGGNQLQIYSIADASNPTLMSVSGGASGRMATSGNYLYMGAYDPSIGVRVINVANKAAPVPGVLLSTTNPFDLATFGSYLYVADSHGGLRVVSLANPANPQIVNTITVPGQPTCQSVAVSANRLITLWGNTLRIYSLGTPATPQFVGAYASSEYIRGLHVGGNHAFVAHSNGDSEIEVIDISDSAQPQLVDVLTVGDNGVLGIDSRPGVLMLACGSAGVRLIITGPPGDFDQDGDVDLSDLSTLLAHFGLSGGATKSDGDTDGDADVDLSDLAVLLGAFGATCP
jgi:hypothetical protein